MTDRKKNRAALSSVEARLAGKPKSDDRKTFPISDQTRSVLMGMQLQAQTIQEAQAALNRVASAYNSTMQAIGALAARAENKDVDKVQLDVDRMVWVQRVKE